MKTTSLLLLLLGLLAPAAPARAAEDLSAILQRGLFEEEANHDLAAAIKAYESVVSATDTQRKLAGTALFRLAECYRKLGRTNEAVTRYQRVLREYPDQPKLIELSREYLVTSAPSALTATRDSERMRQLERSLGEAQTDVIQKSALYAQLTNTSRSDLRRSLSAIFPDTLLTRLQEDQAKAEQRLPELAQAVSPNHPDFKAATALRELIQKQIDDRIDGILGRFKLELLSRQANVAQLQKELDAERQSASSERTPALSKSSLEEQRRLYQEEIAILEKDMEGLDAQRKAGVVASATVSAKQRELLTARRRLAALSPTPADGDANNAPTDEDKEVRRIQALIKDSPDLINAADQNRSTPLHRAAGAGNLVVARFLLANKAAVNARKNGNMTPLHDAVASGSKAMAELLLANGADVNAANSDGNTPLHLAAGQGYKAIAELLIANKANVNAAATAAGGTPLHLAAEKGFKSVAETLLDNGAGVNAIKTIGFSAGSTPPWEYRGRYGTALHMAVARGDQPMTELLMAHAADVSVPNPFGETPLHIAAAVNNVEIARQLLRAKAEVDVRVRLEGESQGQTPLDFAVANGHLQMVEFLLDNGADPNLRYRDSVSGAQNQSPLTAAYSNAKINNRDRIVAALLAHKADPNARRGDGYAPLHFLTMNLQPKVFGEMLLTNGADVEIRDSSGNTPLCLISGGKDNIELLLDHKANPNAQNDEGRTPLHRLVERTFADNLPGEADLAELLIARGADVNIRNRQGQTPLNLYGVPANTSRVRGLEMVQLLRKHGARDEQLDLEPDPNSIRIWRKGLTSGRVVFVRDAAGRNRFTLMEAILNFFTLRYKPATLAPRPPAEARVPKPAPVLQPGSPIHPTPSPNAYSVGYGGIVGIPVDNYDPVAEFAFPDLGRIRIIRFVDGVKTEKKILTANLINAAGMLLCENDLPLEFGDIIEIQEREYRLNEQRVGLTGDEGGACYKCTVRNVSVVVKGETTTLKLGPNGFGAYLAATMKQPNVRQILRSSSDLSRLRIRRLADPATGPPAREWTVDLETFQRSGATHWEDLWLRDGDVIEVPDRE